MKPIYILYLVIFTTILSCSKPDMTVKPPPGTTAVNTIVDYLKNQFDFSLFAAAVEKSGLADSMAKQEYTVFAVNNNGFNNMGIFTPADFDGWPVDSLRSFLKTHTLPGRVFYSTIPRSLDTEFESINGDKLLVSYFSTAAGGQDPALFGKIFINGIKIIPDPKTSFQVPDSYGASLLNGIVYQIPTAIKTRKNNLQQFLASRPELSIFVAGLKKFAQWERLATEQQITVFAPPDSVFLRYGITADSINKMDLGRIKSLFMDAYILNFNRVFTNDIQSYTNLTNIFIPYSNPTLLLSPTSDSNIGFVMLNSDINGCFLFDGSVPETMPNHTGGEIWNYKILGSNFNSVPVYDDWNTGYNIPYAREYRYFGYTGVPTGVYMNYNCTNGVVHYINGLLLMPDQALK